MTSRRTTSDFVTPSSVTSTAQQKKVPSYSRGSNLDSSLKNAPVERAWLDHLGTLGGLIYAVIFIATRADD